jgi:O-antigen/teichoic acid export membrane protein
MLNKGAMNYVRNTSWLFAEKALRMFVGLFVGIWVARYLGPEKFGLFNYAVSFVGLFSAFATLGLHVIVVRELVKKDSNEGEILGTAFIMKLVGAIISLILIAVTLYFTSNDQATTILIFIIASSTVLQSFNVIDYYFQSKVMSKYVVYANIISLFISSILKIYFIFINASLNYFAWLVLFDSFILICGLIYFFARKNPNFNLNNIVFKKTVAVALLKDCWPLILSTVVVSVYMKIDQVMIKNMLDSEAVGQYAAAVRLSEAWYVLPSVIVSSVFPAILNAREANKDLYFQRLQKLYDLMVWLAISIAVPVTFFADEIVTLLYGEAFNQTSYVLMLHIWTAVFVFLGFAFSRYLVAESLTKKSFYRALLGALSNVLLNYILIPKYGITGAAVATLIGQLVSNYLYDIIDKDLHVQFKMKTMSIFPIHIIKSILN